MNSPETTNFNSSEKSNILQRCWSSLPFRVQRAAAIALPVCAVMFFSVTNIVIEGKIRDSGRMVRASLQASARGRAVLAAMVDAEAGVLGYALTRNPTFLKSWKVAMAGRHDLEQAWEPNGQAQDASRIAAAVRNTFARIERTERYIDGQAPVPADPRLSVLLTDGRGSIDKLRYETDRFERDLYLQLESLDRQLSADLRLGRAADFLFPPAVFLAVLFSAWLLDGVTAARVSAAYQATQALAAGLPVPLPPGGKDKIGALIGGMIERDKQLAGRNEELAEALSRVREASEHKSRFLANMSHELRTPLNSVIGFTEVVFDKRAGALTATQEEFLGDSLRSARHLLALINDILDLEKIVAGHLVLSPEPFDLHQLIGETIHELNIIALEDKKVDLSAELDDLVRRVVLDRQKTKQILVNLLTNALKFTPDGGRVTVRARAAASGRCVLEVEDTGTGISESGQARLFREFEQLDVPASKRLQGTGLGLALTKKLVEAQGGTIVIDSQVGVGSTFCVMLPGITV